MTIHREFENLIQKKLDREISTAELDILNDHLTGCPACAAYHAQLQIIANDVFSLSDYFPDQGFNARVLGRLGIGIADRALSWTKVASVLGLGLLSGLVVLAIRPFSGAVFGKVLTLVPAAVGIADKAQIFLTGAARVLAPIFKAGFDPRLFLIGTLATGAAIFVYAKITRLKKEEPCKV